MAVSHPIIHSLMLVYVASYSFVILENIISKDLFCLSEHLWLILTACSIIHCFICWICYFQNYSIVWLHGAFWVFGDCDLWLCKKNASAIKQHIFIFGLIKAPNNNNLLENPSYHKENASTNINTNIYSYI